MIKHLILFFLAPFYLLDTYIYLHLFTAENDHSSMPVGLSVLAAFLFFVIVEKFVTAINEEAAILPEQETDETSTKDANKEKEIDNNNFIMPNTEKNGFTKECLKKSIEVSLSCYII